VDPNIELMTEIRDKWSDVIDSTCRASSIPPAFIASLIAEESGGKIDAKRFEPGVLHSLWSVLMGRAASLGSIGRRDLLLYVMPTGTTIVDNIETVAKFFAGIDDLATSWGLTQIMGYHVLERWTGIVTTLDLALPARSLPLTLRLLAQFALRFQLSLAKDFSEMFSCWNTGEPNGKTADPEYIPRGLARMAIYGQLPPASS
jgi:hypothetical protein